MFNVGEELLAANSKRPLVMVLGKGLLLESLLWLWLL
jgi:hypothetical protein